MRVLFDNGTPRGLARFLTNHSIEEARLRGWEELANGELIQAAEDAGFDLLITTDKNIRYQQNLSARRLSLVVLERSAWPLVRQVTTQIAEAIEQAEPGSYTEVPVPPKQTVVGPQPL